MGKPQEKVDCESRQKTNCMTCWYILLAISIFFLPSFIGCDLRPTPEPYEIAPEFKGEVDQLYNQFCDGKILHVRSISAFGHPMEVSIVDDPRGAEYGFVPLTEKMSRVWIVRTSCYEIMQYNTTHLFVIIDEKHCHDLERQDNKTVPEDNETEN